MEKMIPTSLFCVHPPTHLREVEGDHRDTTALNCGVCEWSLSGGDIFNCTLCDSNLHSFCKSCPPFLDSILHTVLGHLLVFFKKDSTSYFTGDLTPHRSCSVCEEDVRGASYACIACNLYVHPLCSQIPQSIPHGLEADHLLQLQIQDDSSDVSCHVCKDQCGKFGECGVYTCSRYVYRCEFCSINVHYWCILKTYDEEPYKPCPSKNTSQEGERGGTPATIEGEGQRSTPATPHHPLNVYNHQYHPTLGYYGMPYPNLGGYPTPQQLYYQSLGYYGYGMPYTNLNPGGFPATPSIGEPSSNRGLESGVRKVAGRLAVNFLCSMIDQGSFFG